MVKCDQSTLADMAHLINDFSGSLSYCVNIGVDISNCELQDLGI